MTILAGFSSRIVPDNPSNFSPLETASPLVIERHQRTRLAELFSIVRQSNPFYQRKLAGIDFAADRDELSKLPFTTRDELQRDQAAHPPYGSNLTFPLDQYCRFHQTSGTHGRPMRWLDTADSWKWVAECWCAIFTAAGVGRGDRVLFPFSFGPFLGFWAAFDGATRLGAMAIPAGGTSSRGRLQLIGENQATVICCTPTYAVRLADSCLEENLGVGSAIRAIIVAGEPGGSLPEIRRKIATGFPLARVFDHHGMTEIGPVSFECREAPGGVHINEAEFIPEVIDPATGVTLPDGGQGELVLTNLGRTASPLIRYRTGDQVRMTRQPCLCGRSYARLAGGILGRTDDMFTIRGNNVFPSAVEAIVRRFSGVDEYRLTVLQRTSLAEVKLEIDPVPGPVDADSLCGEIAEAVYNELHFRVEVLAVPCGSLPRFEMKARRFIREQN